MYGPAFLESLAPVFPASRLGAHDNVSPQSALGKTHRPRGQQLAGGSMPEAAPPAEILLRLAGSSRGRKPVYNLVHGPILLVAYENMPPLKPASGTGVNHVHRVLRVPGNDFGED